jgi:hypothetical protein
MYHPGMDCGLAQVWYAEMLAEAAQDRASRRARGSRRRPSARRLVLAFAALAPLVLWMASTLAAH